MTLFCRSLVRSAPLVTAVSALMAGFQVALVLVASSFDRAQSFDRLALVAPSFVQRSLGSGLHAVTSFSGMVSLGYFHPLVTITVVLTATYLATEIAGDVETGMVDLVLGRPIARHWLVTRSLVHSVVATAVVVTIMWVGTSVALAVLGPAVSRGPSSSVRMELALHLVALGSCFGAWALAWGAVVRRRATAMAGASLFALALYLLELIAPFWPTARLLVWASPFHYFPGIAIVTGASEAARDFAVLVSLAVCGAIVAYRAFAVRDL